MSTKANFHTHSKFCDGKNTAEEMVLAAIDKGFTVLGFYGSVKSRDDGAAQSQSYADALGT